MADVGGGVIKEFSFSKAWGVNPSAATGTVLLDIVNGGSPSFNLAVGDYVIYSFGSVASFPGIVSEVMEDQSFGQGRQQRFTVVDNRVRLSYQWVFAAFNIEDDTARNCAARPPSADAGSSSSSLGTNAATFDLITSTDPLGVVPDPEPATPWTQRRRYRHLLPQHWQSGLWTYTDAPLTTVQILNYAFNNAWGDFGFSRNYHSALNSVVLTGLDYSTGIRLANLISEINSKTGLDITIDGARTLIWGRKGEGLLPVKDTTCAPYSSGLSLSANDTGVRVVGERTRIQCVNISLVPDWKEGWGEWIDEVAWRREIATTFSLPTATKADEADLSAYARQVTVYQYAKAKNDTSLLDSRPFGKTSRNDIPAWVYIRELVYRSYRIPSGFSLHGVPLSSLDIADSLLLATDVKGEGVLAKQVYATSPAQFYPAAQASAIVRGQPLDLINERDIRLFYRNVTRDLRNEWTTAPDFEVDAINKSIRFGAPTFIDGDPTAGESIYLKINKGEGGGEDLASKVEEGSDYLDIVVPNPDFKITPAEVKASFCFLAGRFFKDYGRGPRRGSINSSGLDLHLIETTNTETPSAPGLSSFPGAKVRLPSSAAARFMELLYQDGGGAIAKADALADSAILHQSVQASGGFTRNGLVGTALTPVVDRITVNVNTSTGITEQVEFTKARSSGAAFAERTLQRIQRTEELYSGQDALKREIREYRLIAAAERRPVKGKTSGHTSMAHVFEKPVGCENASTQTVRDTGGAAPAGGWKAGHIVWLDAKGTPVSTGGAFGGVVVCAPSSGSDQISIAYTGRVPVQVAAGIPVNSVIASDPGSAEGSTAGSVTIGRLAHGEATPAADSGKLLAMVDLGGGSPAPTVPLHIVDSRPSYIPAPASPPAGESKRYHVTWGTLNDQLATNWDDHFDITETTYFFASATVPTTGSLKVTSWEILTGTTVDAYVTGDWESGDDRPATAVHLLGSVIFTDGKPEVVNAGGGSLLLTEHITSIAAGGSAGTTVMSKHLHFLRLNY